MHGVRAAAAFSVSTPELDHDDDRAFPPGNRSRGVLPARAEALDIRVTPAELNGVFVIEPDVFRDDRGFFAESYRRDKMAGHGLDLAFVQDNHSRSRKNVVRGFHFQDQRAPQYRLVRCTVGTVWDVVVDLRVGSPTLGQWIGVELSAENMRQLLIPPEFAHGFAVLSDVAEVQYKCTAHHSPAAERALAWNDPDVAVTWPIADPILSQKDRTAGMSLRDYLNGSPFRMPELCVPA